MVQRFLKIGSGHIKELMDNEPRNVGPLTTEEYSKNAHRLENIIASVGPQVKSESGSQ